MGKLPFVATKCRPGIVGDDGGGGWVTVVEMVGVGGRTVLNDGGRGAGGAVEKGLRDGNGGDDWMDDCDT